MSELENAIQLIRFGRKGEAQPLLQTVIKNDPKNIPAWFWYVETCETAEKRIQALDMCLKMNPGNPQVTQALERFRVQIHAAPIQPEPAKPVPPPTPAFTYYEEEPAAAQNDDLYDYDSVQASNEPVRPTYYFEEDEKPSALAQNNYGYDQYRSAPEAMPSAQKKPWEMDSSDYVDNSMLSKSKKPLRTYGTFDVWATALTQGGEAYEDLLKDPNVSLGRAFTWMALAGLVSALLLPFLVMFNPQFSELTSLSEFQSGDMTGFLIMFTLIMLFVAPISSVINLAISGGLQSFLAGFFGGTGNFTRTVYALAAFLAPMSIIVSLLAIIPIIGQCLTIPLGFYNIVLNVRALRAAHSISTGAALGVIFAPALLVMIFGCLLVFLLGGSAIPQQ